MRIKTDFSFILFLLFSIISGYAKETGILFASVLAHEVGHAVVAKKLGMHVKEIVLFPFGGIACMEDLGKYGGYHELVVAFGGPFTSAVLAAVFYAFSGQTEIIVFMARCNFFLFILNLIPALPMDGGRIVRNLLVRGISYKGATRTMVLAGRLLAIGLLLYNIQALLKGSYSMIYAAAAFFIFAGTVRETRFSSYYYLLHQNNMKSKQLKRQGSRCRVIKVSETMLLRQVAAQFSPGNCCVILVVDRNGSELYRLNEADIMDGLLHHGYDATINCIKM